MIFKLQILFYFLKFIINDLRINSRKALERHQEHLFSKLILDLKQSPFYRPYATKATAITDFPIISKRAFMDNFNEINTVGVDKNEAISVASQAEQERVFSPTIRGITVGLSSGTSGNKGIFLISRAERARWVAAVLHRVIGFKLRKRKIAFFLRANSNLYESVRSSLLSFTFFDTLKPCEENFNALRALAPNILIGQPSVLMALAKQYQAAKEKVCFEQIISVAEVLDPFDKNYLEKVFGLRIDQVYQCTEGFLAYTCPAGNLHFNEDFILLERAFITGTNRYHPVITDLYRRSQPVIRYKLDDLIIEGDTCPCGSVYRTIERIEGRADDVLCFAGQDGNRINVYPDFIRRQIILSSDDIIDYAVCQTGLSELAVHIELRDMSLHRKIFLLVKSRLSSFLRSLSIYGVKVTVMQDHTLEPGKKQRRIRNETSSQFKY